MKNFSFLFGIISCIILLSGCNLSQGIDVFFTIDEVLSLEVFSGGVPARAEKKTITDAEDIKDIMTDLNKLTIERNATDDDRISGGIGNRFLFNLTDGNEYMVIVHQNLLWTADGVYIVKEIDIGKSEFWNSLDYDPVKVDESELPFFR